VPASERLAVTVVASHVTPHSASDDVQAGAREALAESGLLRSGAGYPRAEIEVLRIDEESEGIADVAGAPLARGLRVGVVARAWVRERAQGPLTNDTGDVRAFSVIAAEREPNLASELLFERAVRAAARRVGHRLGSRIAGHPAASE